MIAAGNRHIPSAIDIRLPQHGIVQMFSMSQNGRDVKSAVKVMLGEYLIHQRGVA
jgi:hypothetical protein